MKATTDQLKQAYSELKSLKKVAEKFGMCAQSVHQRLNNSGVKTTQSGLWTPEQVSKIIDWYGLNLPKNKFNLQGLADSLGKTKNQICLKAKKLGLTNTQRVYDVKKDKVRFKTKESLSAHISATRKAWIARNGHPRGSLGMKHTQKTKKLISISSKNKWRSMTKKQQEDRTEKAVITRIAKNTASHHSRGASWKAGWRDIGPQRIYARSRWEANIARMLELRRLAGDLVSWEHEPVTFWFEKIKRGVRSYKPDFRVIEDGKEPYFIEVKGWMDARSKTTLKRMKKYHPSVKIDVIDSKRYAIIKKQLQYIVEGWESDSKNR